ncbi:FkbM family methyltransferase [Sinisalibacter lacisalsi]|uniref:FkbM family methyltransferase n=1 Tax=Sinisalibacter lacisalsi TaxID=1526570 RepID=A0ABQ1QNZ5_9RHOB|nr:FkbM family methyltransferase [Sinisalibacter lacisalsi]GGD35994.1 hypothetical protein GCM10011358_19750 [Sinisalibacter lacisalsi]
MDTWLRSIETADIAVATLSDGGTTYQIAVPDHATDYIQKKLFETGVPYELEMLRDMAERVSPGDLVIDVGANVGNHALYLAAVCRCRVLAFEPNTHLAEALEQSARINGVADGIRVHAVGVGAKAQSAAFTSLRPDNLGAQALTLGQGEIPVVTLDEAAPGDGIHMMKIDVEGMELAVLEGAQKLISGNRPIIYVESATEESFQAVAELLRRHDYVFWNTFNATPTHLFLPAETAPPEAQARLRAEDARKAIRQSEKLRQLRAKLEDTGEELKEARAKSRRDSARLRQAVADLEGEKARVAALTGETAALGEELEAARTKYRTVTAQLREARSERDSERAAWAAELSEFRAANAGLLAALDEAEWRATSATRSLTETQALRDAETRRADAAEREARSLQDDVEDLARRLRAHWAIPARAPASPLESGQTPRVMAAWLQALAVEPDHVARRWLELADELDDTQPDQALALLATVHAFAPDALSARRLGFKLIESGAGAAALEILAPVVEGLNLSSREVRLLQLARSGIDGAELRARAANVVRSPLRAAVIMDEFTALGYAPECDLQQLSVTGWAQELEAFRPQILLVESAWRGLDEAWGPKVGQLSSEVQGILSWCAQHGVPTAFWNKEDPVHFETFLTTAQKFDHVFTTDVDCIARYKAALGHDRVHLLPFACQPEIHNPIESEPRKDAFCFAGAYYTRYPDRTRDLDEFLSSLTGHRPFEIFDRNHGKDHPDYMFPQAYRHHIVGSLPPSQIDRAYKGYALGINLNSVKHSQSMFARRVYELLACNTRVVSNYAAGLRRMFGDLVIATDSGAEALRRIRKQDETGLGERLRLIGLRKVMSQHTYGHRLARIARFAGLDTRDPAALPRVTVLARADSHAEAETLLAQIARQSFAGLDGVLVIPDDIPLPETEPGVSLRRIAPEAAAGMRLADLAAPGDWLAGFVSADYYGPEYLTDLILAARYSHAPVLGKAGYHRLGEDGAVTRVDGPAYVPVCALALRRSLIRSDWAPQDRLTEWLDNLPRASAEGEGLLALDPFGYCEDGAREAADAGGVAAAVDDPQDLDLGIAEPDLAAFADAIRPTEEPEPDAPRLTGADLAANMTLPQAGKISWSTDAVGALDIVSGLDDEEHVYIYEQGLRPLSDLRGPEGAQRIFPMVGPGLHTMFVVVWHDAQETKLGHQMLVGNRNAVLDPPEETRFVRLGVRLRGSGRCRLQGLVLGHHRPPPRPILSRSRVLLLTNHYPSYDDLYRNGFVHSRVRAYRDLGGITPDIYRLRPDQDLTWHEFQNVDCMTGSAEQLDALLASGAYDHVLVHFLSPAMWEVLAHHIGRVRVTVWVHGAEVQPWWRRAFNHTTEEELAKARAASEARLAFWRSLFAPLPKNLHFVFVSQYLADEVFEDLQVVCPPEQYEIIHNPIDDSLFAYRRKTTRHRGKILSIRPFASRTYANDLTVAAILALQRRDFFKDLEFRIIGDGPLFDEITAPLAGLPNVTCQKRFLTQAQIAALHRDYGVFLVPSRTDTQGVSRDEAMSSGLVPVTSRVAAIPEFVDETCGYLAEPDDADGLARAITEIWKNPETFRRKSRAAARRVRQQSARDKMIAAELALFAPLAMVFPD